ncbi:MAG: hypothetical protein WCI93_00140 [bacterium]
MEKIQNNTENKDNSKKFENVQEELLDYQFQYIEKLEKGQIVIPEEEKDGDEGYQKFKKNFKDNLDNTFSKYLLEYTLFYHKLAENYEKRIDKKNLKPHGFDEFAQNIFNEIGSIYYSGDKDWKEKILILIRNKLEEIGPEIKGQNDNEEKENLGLLHANITNEKKLGSFGVGPNDLCMNIHLADLYKQKEENNEIKNIHSLDSLAQVANSIVDKYPYIKAVIGKSWLIDSAYGRRYGFIKYDENKNLRNGGFWGQFIDQNGKIKKEEIDKFLETGKAEHIVAMGFIKVEDFLEKYLPKDRKGDVELADLTKESLDFGKDIDRISKEINEKWESLSADEIISLLKSNDLSRPYFESEDGKKFIEMVRAMKKAGVRDRRDFVYENKNDINGKMGKFITDNRSKYEKRKVLIN